MTTLAVKFNQWNVDYDAVKGVVSLDAQPDNLLDLCDETGTVVDKEFNDFLAWLDSLDAYLDEHPYGREGGYVAYATDKETGETVWYSESEGEWQEG